MKKIFAFTLAVLLTACSSQTGISTPFEITAEVSTAVAETPGPPPTAGPSPTTAPATLIPTLPSGMSPTELKYRVLDEFPDFFFCDPDFYPIAREEESILAQQRFPELQANQEEFQAILSYTGLSGTTDFTAEQKLTIYREHKKLNAIYFEAAGDAYKFQIQTGLEGQQGTFITATIDGNGSIDMLQREQSFPSCPICLAAGTLIDTPRGAVRVEELRVGDPVWTANEAGTRVAGAIVRVASVRVPASHRMVHIILSDGRELWASAGHPTADGRIFADLKHGGSLDGARIIRLETVQYEGTTTFDILPSGETGHYWANGVQIGSTLTNDS